mmetsp:Transcript_18712/g.46760  ORF Transcript_18712/g.46760 Transcript_18712/m.46760 type:complete len:480 (+) Transcript_18712:1017-2456(+)
MHDGEDHAPAEDEHVVRNAEHVFGHPGEDQNPQQREHALHHVRDHEQLVVAPRFQLLVVDHHAHQVEDAGHDPDARSIKPDGEVRPLRVLPPRVREKIKGGALDRHGHAGLEEGEEVHVRNGGRAEALEAEQRDRGDRNRDQQIPRGGHRLHQPRAHQRKRAATHKKGQEHQLGRHGGAGPRTSFPGAVSPFCLGRRGARVRGLRNNARAAPVSDRSHHVAVVPRPARRGRRLGGSCNRTSDARNPRNPSVGLHFLAVGGLLLQPVAKKRVQHQRGHHGADAGWEEGPDAFQNPPDGERAHERADRDAPPHERHQVRPVRGLRPHRLRIPRLRKQVAYRDLHVREEIAKNRHVQREESRERGAVGLVALLVVQHALHPNVARRAHGHHGDQRHVAVLPVPKQRKPIRQHPEQRFQRPRRQRHRLVDLDARAGNLVELEHEVEAGCQVGEDEALEQVLGQNQNSDQPPSVHADQHAAPAL